MHEKDQKGKGPSRRAVISAGAAALPLAIAGSYASRSTADASSNGKAAPPTLAGTRAGALAPRPDYVFSVDKQESAPLGVPVEALLVNGQNPGPEIRYREGDMFRVLLQNKMDVPMTVHWHGLIVPNWMDGVPEITQLPIGPKQSFFVEYPIVQAGSYWYHSHFELQEQSGLRGPFVIEEKRPAYDYDHDVTCFAADWLNQSPAGIVPQIRGEQPQTEAVKEPTGDLYNLPGANKPFNVDVNYPGFLLNAGSNKDPWTFACKAGDRLRLRLINGSTATTFRVALDGHEMTIIETDGNPCEPVTVDNLTICTAERYDVLVTIKESGSFSLHWACLGQANQVVGVIHTGDVKPVPNFERPDFSGRAGGLPDYAALRSPYDTTLPEGPIKTFELELGGMIQKYLWSLSGKYYPELYVPESVAENVPLNIEYGDRVRVRLTNKTMMVHPMHLHGHFFRLLAKPGNWGQGNAAMKDTVGVAPGQHVDFEFLADNPGHWFFHCHNLYHLAAGMARVFHYGINPGGIFAPK